MPNRIIRSIFALIIALAFADSTMVSSIAADSRSGKKVRIVLVGDSTVSDSSGWGPGFKELLSERAECFNVAANGRSTMSFMKEGRWTNALAFKGDYYLIQFAHNNAPAMGQIKSRKNQIEPCSLRRGGEKDRRGEESARNRSSCAQYRDL